jgi:hypothetical protein
MPFSTPLCLLLAKLLCLLLAKLSCLPLATLLCLLLASLFIKSSRLFPLEALPLALLVGVATSWVTLCLHVELGELGLLDGWLVRGPGLTPTCIGVPTGRSWSLYREGLDSTVHSCQGLDAGLRKQSQLHLECPACTLYRFLQDKDPYDLQAHFDGYFKNF